MRRPEERSRSGGDLPIQGQVRAPSFADVLDESLRRVAVPPPRASAPWRASPLPRAADPFLFTRPLATRIPRWPSDAHTHPSRPAHRLNDRQKHAFDTLVALGGRLSGDFTADDLQREYRRLAKRYHPDRHGAASAGDRDATARRFAAVTDSYRGLRALVDARH